MTLMFGLIGTQTSAASFNCESARSQVETMICADQRLSALDEKLSAAYANVRKPPRDEKAEKAMQVAWLSARNRCTDAGCLRNAYEARIAELQARYVNPLAGIWLKSFPCYHANAVPPAVCSQEEQDGFYLAIRIEGDRLCAAHSVSTHAGGHVYNSEDRNPSIIGRVKGKDAKIRFESSFGGTGTATLRVNGDMLHWEITTQDGGEHWLPHEAELHRIPAGPSDQMPACGN